jgi:hypothetical protein
MQLSSSLNVLRSLTATSPGPPMREPRVSADDRIRVLAAAKPAIALATLRSSAWPRAVSSSRWSPPLSIAVVASGRSVLLRRRRVSRPLHVGSLVPSARVPRRRGRIRVAWPLADSKRPLRHIDPVRRGRRARARGGSAHRAAGRIVAVSSDYRHCAIDGRRVAPAPAFASTDAIGAPTLGPEAHPRREHTSLGPTCWHQSWCFGL